MPLRHTFIFLSLFCLLNSGGFAQDAAKSDVSTVADNGAPSEPAQTGQESLIQKPENPPEEPTAHLTILVFNGHVEVKHDRHHYAMRALVRDGRYPCR